MFYPLPRLLGRHLTLSASRVGREIRTSVSPSRALPTGRVPLRSPVHRSQGCEKTTPDLVTHDGPPLWHENQRLGRFRLGKVRVASRMRSGASTGLLTRRQGPPDFKVRYKSGIFWLGSERLTQHYFEASRQNCRSRFDPWPAQPPGSSLFPAPSYAFAVLHSHPATPRWLRINFAADALRFLVPTSSNARLSRLL